MNGNEQSMFYHDVRNERKIKKRKTTVALCIVLLLLLSGLVAVVPSMIGVLSDGSKKPLQDFNAYSAYTETNNKEDTTQTFGSDTEVEAEPEPQTVDVPNTSSRQTQPSQPTPAPAPTPIRDTTPPKITPEYSTTNPTGDDVTVVIRSDEPVVCPSGWTQVDANTCQKIYDRNADEEVVIKDTAGNETGIRVNIPNIDKAPIVATISSSEHLYNSANGLLLKWTVNLQISKNVTIDSGWSCVSMTPSCVCTKAFMSNDTEVVTLQDATGRTQKYQLTIQSIGLGSESSVFPTLESLM
ncbi:MAG: hypothetical protein LBE03_00685 [Candidatus Nomurabacteria bacterium]|jgi:hypothetical protein|nr:hypothetical protein [Candidatus Nomurabacteria bacterium]